MRTQQIVLAERDNKSEGNGPQQAYFHIKYQTNDWDKSFTSKGTKLNKFQSREVEKHGYKQIKISNHN